MFANQNIEEQIDVAWRDERFCVQCGSPTVIVEHDDAMWLECSSLAHRPSRLRSLITLDFASLHTRRTIAPLSIAA
jgi:ribosomal protein S27AE